MNFNSKDNNKDKKKDDIIEQDKDIEKSNSRTYEDLLKIIKNNMELVHKENLIVGILENTIITSMQIYCKYSYGIS